MRLKSPATRIKFRQIVEAHSTENINSPHYSSFVRVSGGFPPKRASDAKNVSWFWYNHIILLWFYAKPNKYSMAWWRHQMETFSALLALCAGNSPVSGEFPAQRPVTRSFDIFFDLSLNKRLSKQSRGWWFETISCPLWRQCNGKTPILIWITKQLLKLHEWSKHIASLAKQTMGGVKRLSNPNC